MLLEACCLQIPALAARQLIAQAEAAVRQERAGTLATAEAATAQATAAAAAAMVATAARSLAAAVAAVAAAAAALRLAILGAVRASRCYLVWGPVHREAAATQYQYQYQYQRLVRLVASMCAACGRPKLVKPLFI